MYSDPIFWDHAIIVFILLTLFYTFFMWKKIKPELLRFWYFIKHGFVQDTFDMQMDCESYKEILRSIPENELTESRLKNIHSGIEEFRVMWERKCDAKLVATYVSELYAIHNKKPVKFEVSVEGLQIISDK